MTSCARCDSDLEEHDLRCSICALPVPVVRGPRAVANHAKILRCTECGAATTFSPVRLAPLCVFCNAAMRVEQPIDPIEQAQVRVPFTVERAHAETALRGWLATRGFFAPKALRDEAVLESLHPIAWAAWIVDATAAVAWTADSNHGAKRSAWAPHAGEAAMQFDRLCVPASRGLELAECHALAPHYDLATSVPVGDDPQLRDENVEGFEAQRSAARHLVRHAIEATAAERVEAFIPGKRFRKVHVACLVESQTTRRVALPAWILAYRYRDRPYRAIVHGQQARIVVGTSPKDWTKIGAIAAAILVVAFALAMLLGLGGCGSPPATPDAVDFTERCTPS